MMARRTSRNNDSELSPSQLPASNHGGPGGFRLSYEELFLNRYEAQKFLGKGDAYGEAKNRKGGFRAVWKLAGAISHRSIARTGTRLLTLNHTFEFHSDALNEPPTEAKEILLPILQRYRLSDRLLGR